MLFGLTWQRCASSSAPGFEAKNVIFRREGGDPTPRSTGGHRAWRSLPAESPVGLVRSLMATQGSRVSEREST